MSVPDFEGLRKALVRKYETQFKVIMERVGYREFFEWVPPYGRRVVVQESEMIQKTLMQSLKREFKVSESQIYDTFVDVLNKKIPTLTKGNVANANETEMMRLFGERSKEEMHDLKRKFVKEQLEREHKKNTEKRRFEAELRNEHVQDERHRREEEARDFQARINALSASTERTRKMRVTQEKQNRDFMLSQARKALRANNKYETVFE